MHQLQRSWVRSQHPSAQWNLRGGRWSSAEYCTEQKEKKSPPFFFLFLPCRVTYSLLRTALLSWRFLCLKFREYGEWYKLDSTEANFWSKEKNVDPKSKFWRAWDGQKTISRFSSVMRFFASGFFHESVSITSVANSGNNIWLLGR